MQYALTALNPQILRDYFIKILTDVKITGDESFTYKDQIFLQLVVALSNDEMQHNYLDELIETYSSEKNLEKKYTFLRELGVILSNYPPESLSQHARDKLIGLLTGNKNLMANMHSSFAGVPVFNWLDVYATVMSNTESEKKQFAANYITQVNDDPITLSQFITFSKNAVIQKIDRGTKIKIISRLENGIQTMRFDFSITKSIRTAIKKLQATGVVN